MKPDPGLERDAGRASRRAAPALIHVGPLTPHLFAPSPARPLRAKAHVLQASTLVEPHRHDWWQISFSSTGILRMTAGNMTYTVPPARALWVPPGVEHSISVVEDAMLHTLYGLEQAFMQSPPAGTGAASPWQNCCMLELSELLRLLVLDFDTAPDPVPAASLSHITRREALIAPLLYDELSHASTLAAGVPMPRDKRLRMLCQAMLVDATPHGIRLEEWAAEIGASPRTVLRLFHRELGMTFAQWRQQATLAQAWARMARGQALGRIASDLGYDSPSAFSAMFRRHYGESPSQFARRLATHQK